MMIKRAYAVQMSYDVTDAEKQQAEKAIIHFNHAIKLLSLADNHLNIMKIPFKNNPEISPEDVMKARAAIRRFRDQSVDGFNDFKVEAFKCVNIMKNFSSDMQTIKLMRSFISSVDALEIKVNDFVALFDELESKEFSKNVVSAIDEIQKQCEEIDEIIDERIKDHIQSNILAKSWVDSVSNELQIEVEEKTPIVMDLFNKRQKILSDKTKEN